MSQTRTMSWTEAAVNTSVGLVLSFAAVHVICWAYDIPMSTESNLIITFWMTVISILRSYILRRLFNKGWREMGIAALEFYEKHGHRWWKEW